MDCRRHLLRCKERPHPFGCGLICVGIIYLPGKCNGLSLPLKTCRWHVFGKKKPRLFRRGFVLALSIFPASRPASIVDADELNFCVRDGNRWTLIAINTNYVDGFCPSFICQSALRSNSLWIIAPFSLFVNSCFVSLAKSKPSEAGLIWKRRAAIQAEYHARVIWSIVSCARSW